MVFSLPAISLFPIPFSLSLSLSLSLSSLSLRYFFLSLSIYPCGIHLSLTRKKRENWIRGNNKRNLLLDSSSSSMTFESIVDWVDQIIRFLDAENHFNWPHYSLSAQPSILLCMDYWLVGGLTLLACSTDENMQYIFMWNTYITTTGQKNGKYIKWHTNSRSL